MSRLFSIEPVGILKAWRTNVRTNSARMTAMTIDSKYSRAVDFLKLLFTVRAHPQNGEERFLRDVDFSHPFHALLAFLLFLEQLPLARDVAAVTLGEHVLAHRLDRFTRDDAPADRRLNRDLEHLTRNQLAHLRRQRAAAIVCHVPMDDDRQRVDRIAVHENI